MLEKKPGQPAAAITQLRRRNGDARYFVATLAKALDTLEALAEVDSDISLAKLAKRLGFSSPTLFRILSTLCARGYVQKNMQTGPISAHAEGVGSRDGGRPAAGGSRGCTTVD